MRVGGDVESVVGVGFCGKGVYYVFHVLWWKETNSPGERVNSLVLSTVFAFVQFSTTSQTQSAPPHSTAS